MKEMILQVKESTWLAIMKVVFFLFKFSHTMIKSQMVDSSSKVNHMYI